MRQTKLFTKTQKQAPSDADSANAQFLVQAGFINQVMSGVYTYLPLGLRTLRKIQGIVREEMDAIGGQEVLMPVLTPKEGWQATGRWDELDVLFKLEGAGEKEYALGATHEEVVTPLAKSFCRSYKDFPFAIYQIQDKFRNELRCKSGILRGREFNMKDLYSFHTSELDMEQYYQRALEAYTRIFKRCGIEAIVTEAGGGSFSKVSHEFQMPTDSGEDIIFVNEAGTYAWNREVADLKDGDMAPDGSGPVHEVKAIEVGNIFPLKTKYSEAFNYTYIDENGKEQPVMMGCYGIGPSRTMGAIVEAHHDERGIIWPNSVAPFHVHLISLSAKEHIEQERIVQASEALYEELQKIGVEVLWNDRGDQSAGEKFADADLIGLPLRIVISQKTLTDDSAEWKERAREEMRIVKLTDIAQEILAWVRE